MSVEFKSMPWVPAVVVEEFSAAANLHFDESESTRPTRDDIYRNCPPSVHSYPVVTMLSLAPEAPHFRDAMNCMCTDERMKQVWRAVESKLGRPSDIADFAWLVLSTPLQWVYMRKTGVAFSASERAQRLAKVQTLAARLLPLVNSIEEPIRRWFDDDQLYERVLEYTDGDSIFNMLQLALNHLATHPPPLSDIQRAADAAHVPRKAFAKKRASDQFRESPSGLLQRDDGRATL